MAENVIVQKLRAAVEAGVKVKKAAITEGELIAAEREEAEAEANQGRQYGVTQPSGPTSPLV